MYGSLKPNMEEIMEKSDFDDPTLISVRNRNTNEVKEAVVIKYEDEYKCWLNYCKHITTINIHKGGEAPIRDDEIVCQNHGAMFNIDTGVCTFGPCEGARLDPVEVETKSGRIVLTDENYEFVDIGGINREDAPKGTTGEDSF
jgi:nitrite reductase/ring-hydroxylating ferredoxin subunit